MSSESTKVSYILGFDSPQKLIGYCELHSKTQRALFNGIQIREMYRLAGEPVPQMGDDDWASMHEEMYRLCKLAREKLRK